MNDIIHVFYILAIAALAAGAVYYAEDLRADVYSQFERMGSDVDSRLTQLEAKQAKEFKAVYAGLSAVDDFESDIIEMRARDRTLSKRLGGIDDVIAGMPKRADLPGIASKALDSVVKVTAMRDDKEGFGLQEGSGFFVSRDGYVVTNAHVVVVESCEWLEDETSFWGWTVICSSGPASEIMLTLEDGTEEKARIVGFDERADVAVLKADGVFEHLGWGNSAELKQGDPVLAIGNPQGLDFSVTTGIVSAVRKLDMFWGGMEVEYVQFDAAVDFGSSGGPLLDKDGNVIGINTLAAGDLGDLNLAISSNFAQPIVDKFVRND